MNGWTRIGMQVWMTHAKRNLGKGALLALMILAGVLFHPWIREGVELLSGSDPALLLERLRALGPWAAVASFFLAQLQAVLAPLPAFLVTLANGALFGPWWGFLLSWVSLVAAALLCFFLARLFGQDWLERKISPEKLNRINEIIEKDGLWAIFLFRLLPFLPFDPLSYALGLSRMSAGKFLLANLLAQLPATLFYALVGAGLAEAELSPWLSGLPLLILIPLWRRRQSRRAPMKADAPNGAEV